MMVCWLSISFAMFLLFFPSTSNAQKSKYKLAVIVLDDITLADVREDYQKNLLCSTQIQSDSMDLEVELKNLDKNNFSPRGVLNVMCELESEISTVALILPDSSSFEYLAVYKYVLNHISSLGIPVIVWNSYMPKGLVYDAVIQLGPQYEQQAEAYMSLLKYYNWDKFSILTTLCPGHVEFSSAMRRLVHDYVNEKGEQIMEILSSHVIEDSKNRSVIRKHLNDLYKSDTRIILLHMTGKELKLVMSISTELKMTGKEYMWLGTTQTHLKSFLQPRDLPPGMIALAYANNDNSQLGDAARNTINPLTKAMLTLGNFWRDVIVKYHYKKSVNSTSPKLLSCNSTEFWNSGQELYSNMIGYRRESLDLKCTGSKVDLPPVEIDQKGKNMRTSLNFMNLAYSTSGKSRPNKSNGKIWKWIGMWHAPNVTVLDDITWPGLSPKPPDGKPARSFLRVVTHEEAPYVKFANPDPVSGACETIGSVRVRLTNVTEQSCPECKRNSSLFQCATGLCIDLLNKLKEDMMFDYELFQSRDNNWGNYIEGSKKEWNGIVRDLIDGYADISMTSLKIGPERSTAIDFSVPFIETGITIIVLIKKGVISATAFLEPYEYKVWVIVCCGLSFGIGITIFIFEWGSPIGLIRLRYKANSQEPYNLESWMVILIGAVHITGFFILLFDYLSPAGRDRYIHKKWNGEKFSLARSLWLIWTILFGAAVETDNTKGLASRFLTAIWSLFSLVFLASYTANLAAFMITKEEYFELKGINDNLLKNPTSMSPPFRFGTVPDGSTAINLKKNYPEMFTYMKDFNKEKVISGIEAVKNNELQAFIYDATVLQYQASRDDDCKLTTVGSWYAMTGYGVGFPKFSKWKQKFDVHLTRYINEGEMDRLRKFWMTGACKQQSYGKGRESSSPLDIANFTSAYILLIVGVGLALTLLLVEYFYFTFCRRKLRKVDKNGCCSLLSMSMGESLSFEESVMEVIESTRHTLCQNELCKANQQRLSHELDMAICRLSMIQATMSRNVSQCRIEKLGDDEHTEQSGQQLELDYPNNGQQLGSERPNNEQQLTRQNRVWSKSTRFSDNQKLSAEAEKLERAAAIRSNEKLEALESCL